MYIKAVIFDIDGTFYPNWRMNIKTLPVVLKNPKLFKAFADARMEMRNNPELKVDNFYEIQAELTANRLGLDKKHILEKIERDIYIEWTNSLNGVKPYRDVREVILELQKRGLKTACLSDFPILNKLSFFNLDDLFENTAYSCEECGYLKPHPNAYKFVLEKVGVPAHEVLYVGNSYPYDIVGAKNAGMNAAHISKKVVKGKLQAEFTFSKYRDFIGKFDNLIKGE